MVDQGDHPGALVRRAITIAGHRTSLSLERIFWQALDEEAAARGLAVAALVRQIDDARTQRGAGTLASAVRVFLFRQRAGGTPNTPEA